MITGALVKQQMDTEVEGAESAEQQYERLGVDDQSIRAELSKVTDSLSIAAIIGGICMGLEFAKKHRESELNKSYDLFLQSIAPDGEDFD